MRALKLAHLRVDLPMRGAWQAELTRATNEALALKTQLEVAVFLSDDATNELGALRAALNELHSLVARWLIFHEAEAVTAAGWLEQARTVLRDYDAAATFGAGTNQYFAELNRQLLSAPLSGPRSPYPADVLCYSINPQVHAFDEATLLEALSAQADTVFTARHVMHETPVAVSPITLKPRFNQNGSAEKATDNDWPDNVDARQASLFAACWTLGSLKYLAESGAASATYYETTGWRGVIEGNGETPGLVASGTPYAVYHLFAALSDWADAEVLPVTSTDPLRIIGLALCKDYRWSLWLVNFSEAPQTITMKLPFTPDQAMALQAGGWMTTPPPSYDTDRELIACVMRPLEMLWWRGAR